MELAVSDFLYSNTKRRVIAAFLYSNTKRRVLIPLANSENVTVQGAVATWRPRKSLRTRRQVATAPCTVPIRQQYQTSPHSKGSADLSDFAEALGLYPPNAAAICGVRITSRSCKYSNSIPNPNHSGKKSHRISPCRLYRQCA